MSTLNIPEGYQTLMPYLILKDANGFWDWAQAVLGATEKMKTMSQDGATIAHAELFIDGSTLMLATASEQWPVNTAGLFVYVPDVDAVYSRGIAHGATSIMPPADMPYGRTCGLADPFGNVWWPTTPA